MPSLFTKLRRKSRSASATSTSEVNLASASTSSFQQQPLPPLPTVTPVAGPGVSFPSKSTPGGRTGTGTGAGTGTTTVHDGGTLVTLALPRNADDAGPSRVPKALPQESRVSLDADQIPQRTTSLHETAAVFPLPANTSPSKRASMPAQTQIQSSTSRQSQPGGGANAAPTASRAVPTSDVGTGELTTRLGSMSVSDTRSPSSAAPQKAPQLPPLQLHVNPLVPDIPTASGSGPAPISPVKQLGTVPDLPSLAKQRYDLVNRIATEARARKAQHGGLSEEGKEVFTAAGMEKELAMGSSLEVETRYIKPVIQEHIIIKEHTETTTVIDQEIHRHHIYPKIQPISDPDPIALEPRHRIFSAVDGKWHEVIGDAAAIAILGEEAFYNGKKEVRQDRQPALPGFGGDVEEYSGRVVEREGIRGESMGKWQQIKGAIPGLAPAETPSTPGRMVGEDWLAADEDMGPAQRTVGIAL